MNCPSCGRRREQNATRCNSCGASFGPRYAIHALIGEGSKKRVYRARDARLDRDVALAVLKTAGLDAAARARLREDVRAIGRLGEHPNIVPVYDVGDEDGETAIVNEYLAGGSLAECLSQAEQHRLPVARALALAADVASALEHAHRRGVIHRDLKPSNVWLTSQGTAKLGDFGLAVDLGRMPEMPLGSLVGTLAYIAPEQALGKAGEPRSDLYALGVMLYEMVSGHLPFDGADAVILLSQHLHATPAPPSRFNPEVPAALDALVLQLLAKTPDERPKSAAAVRCALQAIGATSDEPALGTEPSAARAPVSADAFVGREQPMSALHGALDEAFAGRRRLVLLVGDAGIGKTRIAEELSAAARQRGALVLWGRCYEGEGAPAFWPWVQIIRSFVQEHDAPTLMAAMGPGAADIAQVVAEVRDRLPDLGDSPVLPPEQARFRLFDSVTTFLRNAGNARPLVLVLDDLHWADQPSLLLLEFLAREVGDARLLVVGAYRDLEIDRQHPFARTLATLARTSANLSIALHGLGRDDIARFIAATAGVTPPASLVAAIDDETEGNPFFVSEVVRLLAAEGRLTRAADATALGIPQGVRKVILRRLDGLPAETSRILEVAAVVGREFDVDTLEPVTGVARGRLLELLDEAVRAHVVTEVPRAVGSYRFAHALIRETLYGDLSTRPRVRLHHQIAEVLERLHTAAEPPLAALAYHFCEAAKAGEAVEKAIDYASRAGERATAVLAYEEAVRHYERALGALNRMAHADEARQGELVLALAEAERRVGERGKARELFVQAADLARRLGAGGLLARAALGCGADWYERGVVDALLIRLLEDALGVLPRTDNPLRAKVLARLAMELYFTDQHERQKVLSEEALGIARRAGDTAALTSALYGALWSLWGPGDYPRRLAIGTEILRLAEAGGDTEGTLRGHFMRASNLLVLGDIATADVEIAAHDRRSAELRQPLFRYHSVTLRAMRAFLDGRFEEGERLAHEALALGQRAESQDATQSFGVQLFVVRREQGRLAELEAIVQGLVLKYPGQVAWRCALTFLYSELGREAEARTHFEQVAADDFAMLPRNAVWLVGMAEVAESCSFLRDARRAATLYDLLLPYAGLGVTIGYASAFWGCTSQYLGMLAATLGRWDEAQAHFETALQFDAKMSARPWVARAQYDYARMLLARGRRGDGTRALQFLGDTLDLARRLGMKRLIEQSLAVKLRAQGLDTADTACSIDALWTTVEREQPDLLYYAAPNGTVTILFTDMENSTSMIEQFGDQRAQEILRVHNAIVREQVAVHGGFEVKSQGDGFMVVFRGPRRAVHCAIAIERALATYVEQHPEAPIRVRIGLHTGEAIAEDGDFFGRAVILAARIAARAHGGEILVSSLLKELTESAGDIHFDPPREVELKGLTGTHSLHPIAWTPNATTARASAAP